MNTQSTLPSQFIVTQSPMSFSGSLARSRRIVWRNDHAMAKIAVYGFLVPVWWSCILAWYAIMFGLLGLIVVPYRLMRRGQRRRKLDDARHLEQLAAVAALKGDAPQT